MKKKRVLFIIIFMLVIFSVLFLKIYTHTFSNFLIDENFLNTFYPSGIANRYEGINVVSPNEDHRLWKYSLSKQEIKNIDSEVSSDIWKSLTANELRYIYEVYFDEHFFNYTDTDEIYYILYSLKTGNHMSINVNDMLLYGQENLLFVYNKTSSEFYCVSKRTY